MKNTIASIMSIATIAILLLSSLAFIPNTHAVPPTEFHVINAVTGDTQFLYSTDGQSVGYQFWANITLTNFTDVYTWQIKLLFDADLLNAVQAIYPADHIFAGKTTAPVSPVIDNVTGSVLFGNSLSGAPNGVNGTDARLCQIQFEIMEEPTPGPGNFLECDLTFFVGTGGTFLLDSIGGDIASIKNEGYYNFAWAPPSTEPYLEVIPVLTELGKTGEMIVGVPAKSEFEVGIYIRNLDEGWRLIAAQAMLYYNTSVLEYMSATEGPFMLDATWNLYGTYPIVIPESDYVIFGDIILPNGTGYWDQTELPNTDGHNGLLFTMKFKALVQEEYPWSLTTALDLSKLDSREIGVDVDNNYIVFDPSIDAAVKIYGYVLGRQIDVFTQWGGQGPNQPSDMFAPQDLVNLTALVTYNLDPVQHKIVYFYIVSPTGTFVFERTDMTNGTGHASTWFRIPWPCVNYNDIIGVWNVTVTVSIAEETVTDFMQFKVGWYIELVSITPKETEWLKDGPKYQADPMEYTVVYRTWSQRMQSGIISVIVYDNLQVPIATAHINVTIGGATPWCTYAYGNVTVSMPAPSWAYIGPGKAYANCYSELPWNGGHAMCPEVSCDISIVRP